MKRGRNTAETVEPDIEFDDVEPPELVAQERTLVLKAAPQSRRVYLIAQGAREIRCICCNQIRPLAGAEEAQEGWICEDCAPGMTKK